MVAYMAMIIISYSCRLQAAAITTVRCTLWAYMGATGVALQVILTTLTAYLSKETAQARIAVPGRTALRYVA